MRCWLAWFLGLLAAEASPRHVYLTWRGDTSRSITVNYQTLGRAPESLVLYDTVPRGGRPEAYRYRAYGTAHRIDQHPENREIHWVELKPLKPGEAYYFVAGDAAGGFSPERKFRTIPAGREPIRFVTGGDMGTDAYFLPLLRQAALQQPLFGVVGGDIAYENGELRNWPRWDAWLDGWQNEMVTPDGFTIPMVLGIGNHEVKGGLSIIGGKAPHYFGYFAQEPNTSYFSRTFGKNVAIYCLDSGHMAPHGGEQSAWLDETLTAHAAIPFKFAVYHVPFYPSHREYNGVLSIAGRSYWLPLFDKHRLTAGFENHDHTFKRTPLMKQNRPDPSGTLYLGDGCWGRPPRTVNAVRRWYEVKAAPLPHFWRVDVSSRGVEYRAINQNGQIFDVFPETAPGAKEAEAVYQELTAPKAAPVTSSGPATPGR
jgi:acid phosphatase type 7